MRRFALPARGGEMAALELGSTDRPVDVVFAHANGFNGRTYRSILAPAAETLRILAVDLRGHGASTLPSEGEQGPGWTVFRDDLLALLRGVAETPVVLAGHSLGATSSVLAAMAEPERVASLVLFDPVFLPADTQETPLLAAALRRRTDFPSRVAALEAYRGRSAFAAWSEAQLADYVESGFHDADGGGVTLACRPEWEARNYRLTPLGLAATLPPPAMPVRIFRAEYGTTCRETLAGARVETVAATSHFLPMERPDVVTAALLADQ